MNVTCHLLLLCEECRYRGECLNKVEDGDSGCCSGMDGKLDTGYCPQLRRELCKWRTVYQPST